MYKLSSNRCVPNIAFLFLLCMSHSQGLAIKRDVIAARPSDVSNSEPTQCGFRGDSDVLGIGIRIGYYTQALSVWFANYFVISEAKGLRSINLLFLVALFIGLVWLVHKPERSHAIEVYLLLRLLFATWYVGVIDRSKFSKTKLRKSYTRVIVRESSLLGLLAYTVWFSWVGLDRLDPTPCGTFIFFATKVNLYGPYRTAFKAFSISALVFGTIKQLDTAVSLSQRWWGPSLRGPEYYARLQQSLIEDAYRQAKLVCAILPSDLGTQRPLETSQREILESAIQIPLPRSPSITGSEDRSKETSKQISSSVSSDSIEGNLPSLEDLIMADRYLQSIINIDVRNHSRWCYEIKWIPLKIFIPSIHSPSTLYRRIASIYDSRPIRPSILLPLFRHIKSLCRFPLYSYAFMLEAALHSPYHKQVSQSTLISALALHKAQLPINRPTPNVFFHAIASLSMCIVLILSIELSMHWNHITGMSDIGAVGQLIPAIIGLGGLLRVVWIWWSEGDIGRREDNGVEEEIRECAEVYQRLKLEKEGKEAIQGGHNPSATT